MAKGEVVVTAAQAREQVNIRLYVLALIALARQLQQQREPEEGVIRG